MNKFANYENGQVTIATYRLVNAAATDVDDIIKSAKTGSDEALTASINSEVELAQIQGLVDSAQSI